MIHFCHIREFIGLVSPCTQILTFNVFAIVGSCGRDGRAPADIVNY